MPRITAVEGDITTVTVDAIVNAANRRMRGGGGVDGAIHRAGGSAVLADCIARFPRGLATGDAGWTTAGDLPARWVIHTVGPNFAAGETNRELLVSCYRRSLEVADELGARTVAFPLISAGIYRWPREDAISAAVETIAGADTAVTDVLLVAFDRATFEAIDARLAGEVPFRILAGVEELHRRGHHGVRILPGVSPSGMHWRLSIRDGDRAINYTTGAGTAFADTTVTLTSSADDVAEAILRALPEITRGRPDPDYVRWYVGLMELVTDQHALPIAYADYFDSEPGWEIGWGSGVRYPPPPN